MAKGFARTLIVFGLCLTSLSCSKKEEAPASGQNFVPSVETFPLENSKLVNCRFKNPAPVYTFKSTIEPNPILCDEGVAKNVQILTPHGLPEGLEFSQNQLSLVGTANEKMAASAFDFYVENEAGYVLLKLVITVK